MKVRSPLEARLRNAARAGLYGSFLLTTGLFFLLMPWVSKALDFSLDTAWHDMDFEAEPSVQLLQALLRVDTTEATGSEVEAVRLLAAVLEDAGAQVTVEILGPTRANLWSIIEGESPEALVLHSHIDTDPIREPERWTHGPFSGDIESPWIYGRGAFDMKSVAAAQTTAFLDVLERARATGTRPKRSLVLLATSSEETGSHLGAQWIVKRHPELVGRFWALLTEGGVVELTDRDTIKYWGTSFAQKHFAQVTACALRRERLEDLYADLSDRGHLLTGLDLSQAARDFLAAYAPSRQEISFRRILSAPDGALTNLEDFAFLPLYMQALYRNEIHAFPIEASPDGSGYSMRMLVHLQPGDELEAALVDLLPEWMTHGIGLQIEQPLGSPAASPLDHPVFVGIQDHLRGRFETEATGPYFLSYYANDSRFFRAAGIPSYGFSPFMALSTDAATINGPDERIALPAFVGGVELYRELVPELLDLPG